MKMRKWTAMLLTVCMLLSLLPGAAFAEGETLTDENVQVETQVCETCGKDPCVCEKDEEGTQVCETCGKDPCVCEKDQEETQVCETCGEDPCVCEKDEEETQVCEVCGKDPCECEEEPEEETQVCEVCGKDPCECEEEPVEETPAEEPAPKKMLRVAEPAAQADEVETGYNGDALPEGPDMSGTVVDVTPANAQYTLDGAYGSIDGKTINFTAGNYDALELGRTTKYAGSGTKYYKGGNTTDQEIGIEEVTGTGTGTRTYVRTMSNVTFTAESSAVLGGFYGSTGHHYDGAYDYVRDTPTVSTPTSYYVWWTMKNITFDGLTVNGKFNFGCSGTQTDVDGITFQNCTFIGTGTTSADGAAIRMQTDLADCYKNLTVSNCEFTNYHQGVYVQGLENVTVTGCGFTTMGHNAIAVQNGLNNTARGNIVLSNNTFTDGKDRAIRFGNIGENAKITVSGNTADNFADNEGEVMKAGTVASSATVTVEEDNDWGDGHVNSALLPVAKIGDKSYQSLQAAIEAAEDGVETTITMTADITGMTTAEIINVPAGKVIVLDMAGHSITVDSDFSGRAIVNQGTLTVQGNGTIDASSSLNGWGAINNLGTLTIENGTFRGNSESGASNIRNAGEDAVIVINDGTFDTSSTAVLNYDGLATLNGGTYTTHDHNCSACGNNWSYVVRTYTDGNEGVYPRLYVNGGTYTGTQGAMSSSAGYIEINGGTFRTVKCANNHNSIFYTLYAAGEYGGVQCVINGGTFETEGRNTAVLLGNDNTNGDGGINADVMSHVNGGTFIAPEGVPALKVSPNTAKASILHGGTYSLLSADTAEYVDPAVRGEAGNNVTLEKRTETDSDAVAKIGTAVYASLQAAIEAIPGAGSGTVTLLDSVSGLADITIQNKNVTLDLNGNNITFKPDNSFLVNGTKGNVTLNVTGQGTIESSRGSRYYSTIDVYGYKDATHKTEVTIGKDVTIANDGSYGIALNAVDKKAAGVTINVNGTIAAPYGFSVSGNVKDTTEENMPVFNLNETGKMTGYNGAVSTGAVYAAGYAKYNIAGTLEGSAFGIAIKSGTLNVKSGATVSCVGEYAAPTAPYGNGANASGAAIQIEANSSYAGNIQVNVEDGATVKSTNGNAIYQYAKDTESEVKVAAITITGGNFSSGSGEGIATIHVDEQTKTDKKVAISGGTFDEDVSAYCVEGLKAAAKQDESGKWVIVPAGDTVAMVSGVSATKTYESLQAAVAAAQTGDTVTLLTNVTLNTTMDNAAYTSAIMIKKDLTLDGGNNTITVDGPFHGIQVYGNVNVTVKNVTITGAGKDALLVNGGANVTANGLKTSGNAWGAVNVDRGSTFTFDGACEFAENNKVWTDVNDGPCTVNKPEGWNSYTVDGQTFYTNTLTLALNRTTVSLYSNTTPNTVTLTATVEGSVEGKAPVVTWTTSNDAVATVADGVVTAVGNGTATITATVGDLTASCTVTVSRYTSGGGGSTGGGSYRPSRPSRPSQPEEDLGENDVPLAQPLPFIDVTENDWFYAAVRFVFDKDMIKGTNEAGTLFEPLTTTTRGMIVTILHRLEEEPEADAASFSDVAAGAWYTDAVNWAAASGVVKGMEDGAFHPEDVITREQMAVILSRYATLKGYDKSAKGSLDQFQDRALVSDWAEEDMIWALGAGILKGRGDGVLDPTGTTTRSEAAEMLKNFCEKFETSDEK